MGLIGDREGLDKNTLLENSTEVENHLTVGVIRRKHKLFRQINSLSESLYVL